MAARDDLRSVSSLAISPGLSEIYVSGIRGGIRLGRAKAAQATK